MVRRQRSGNLSASEASAALTRFRQDLQNKFHIMEVEIAVVRSAVVMVEVHGLRAYDALQLATAMHANSLRIAMGIPALTLACADREINTAVGAEGLAVEDPNRHP